jgi:UDP-galactopyranose mutase
MSPRYLVVGAGFTGATIARRIAEQLDRRVLLIDRRNHLGGNAFDEANEHGVVVHRYGPHIFHTNSDAVWQFLSRFTDWRPYEHRVMAEIDGRVVPLPFNLNTIDALFPPAEARRLAGHLVEGFGPGARVPVLKLRESADPELRRIGAFVYANVFENYTLKQWGLRPEQLDPAVTGRVPVLVGRDDRYFQDRYQAQPRDGFASLFARMVDHPNIDLALGVAFKDLPDATRFDRVVFTGPIDEFFGYAHGTLPYRSLRFEQETLPGDLVQPVAVVNHPNAHAYTRVTEMKHLTGQQAPSTTLMYEYPGDYVPGLNEPYYPVPREENRQLYARYREEADRLGTVIFAGRLGDYSYYNMDQAVGRGLSLFEKAIARAE